MTGRRLRSRAALTAESSRPPPSSTRPRRGAAAPASSATIERSSPEDTRQSIHLTIKASPNRLREATGDQKAKPTGRRDVKATGVSSRNILDGKRSSRNSRVIREPDTDEEEDEEEDEEQSEIEVARPVEDDDEEEEEEEEDDEDAEGEEDEDMDAEGEEEDIEMEDAPEPSPPAPKTRGVARPVKPSINVIPAPDISAVEAKEIAMADDDASDDEELSELDSQDEELEEDDEGGDEDAEGEDEEELLEGDEDEDMDSDDDDGTPASGSRDQTPDLSKLTRRQRALVVEGTNDDLMALSNEAQKKKHLTAEEITMRRAEMARRRKNLSEKRNEEEKMDTINRLLKKQPSKRQRRIVDLAESGQEDELDVERANPLFVRYVQNVKGAQIGVPDDWLDGPAGRVFQGAKKTEGAIKPFSGRMVEEVA